MKKKILKIMSIITICFVMIFSMCSFTTTTYPYDYVIYESQTQIDISYRYNRDETNVYYGTIPSCNRVLLDPTQTTITGIRNSIKFYGCDMFMGSSTKSIDIRSFTVDGLPSTLVRDESGNLILGICYKSDDTSYSSLFETFYFWNWSPSDCIYIELFDDQYQNFVVNYADFLVTMQVEFSNFDNDEGKFINESFDIICTLEDFYNVYHPGAYSTAVIDLNCIMYEFLDMKELSIEDLGVKYLIKSINLSVQHLPLSGVPSSGYGAIRVNSKINEKDVDGVDISWLDSMINEIVSYEKEKLTTEYDERLQNIIAEKDARINELLTGIENDAAITLLFDGIYRTIYNVLTIFFNMDFFGAKLGTIVGILLGAAVVILILKVVL